MSDRRWCCPGHLCGTYQGYQRGCRRDTCSAVVADWSAQRRAGAAPGSRTRPIDAEAKATALRVLRAGGSLAAAAAAIGVTDYRLLQVRRRDPAFEEQVRRDAGGRLRRKRFDEPDRYLAQLRAGHAVHEAAERIGWEYSAVYYLRLNDPRFDRQVVEAASEGSPRERPGPRVRPVHRLNKESQAQP